MNIEIWSDVLCPFCYIGKRRLEEALGQFEHADQIHITWKSFQLDPAFEAGPDTGSYQDYLSKRKGFGAAQTGQMLRQVTEMARTAGLDFHFDKAVLANSVHAHRLLHFAHTQSLQDALKEALLDAHFVRGMDIGDSAVLALLAEQVGLDRAATQEVLSTDAYRMDVQQDIWEAGQIGVRGVPFFVFDRKYAVSGAQSAEVFGEVLQKAFAPYKLQTITPEASGDSCGVDGYC